ncbi:MAG TPA: hypothetical protein VJ736_11730 [Actinomycetota bacterium]|nr:hypothetical protein [Actinomycetota bacterium]
MLKRSIIATAVAVGLLGSPAFAATAPHGRGPSAQATMIARTAGSSKHPVQVLNQLCDNPIAQRGCSPIKANLQRALERAIHARITWVSHRRHGLGQFWVLGGVRFDRSPVSSMVTWRDPGRYGCNGWTRLSWERHRGAWSPFQGVSAEGCQAVPLV